MVEFQADYDKYFKSRDSDDFNSYYDEVDIVDFKYENGIFTYPCPCGDLFSIALEDLKNGECIARCYSCSLIVFVVYDSKDLDKYIISS